MKKCKTVMWAPRLLGMGFVGYFTWLAVDQNLAYQKLVNSPSVALDQNPLMLAGAAELDAMWKKSAAIAVGAGLLTIAAEVYGRKKCR